MSTDYVCRVGGNNAREITHHMNALQELLDKNQRALVSKACVECTVTAFGGKVPTCIEVDTSVKPNTSEGGREVLVEITGIPHDLQRDLRGSIYDQLQRDKDNGDLLYGIKSIAMREQHVRYVDTYIPGLPGMLVEGPLYPDHCQHGSKSYIGSIEVPYFVGTENNTRVQYDIYAFEGHSKQAVDKEICLRYGADDKYISPGSIKDMSQRTKGNNEYVAALLLLDSTGHLEGMDIDMSKINPAMKEA